MRETWVQSLGQKDPLEKEMGTHSSTLAWKIPWTEEPGRLQSVGSHRLSSGSDHKASAYNAGDWVQSLGQKDPLEKEMATHSSILAWRIPWKEEPGVLQSMGSQKYGNDLATKQQLKILVLPFVFRLLM